MEDDENSLPRWQQRLRTALWWHKYNLQHNPVQAHWDAATASTIFGMAMAVARGAVVASMNSPAQRLHSFLMVTRGTAPLYIIPFVLGSQLDCYQATWAAAGAPPMPMSHVASELG